MKKIHKTLILFLLTTILSFTAEAQLKQTAQAEGITEYTLNNGLKVLLFPDHSAQTITVNITYKVGSKHEGYGEKGMAHLLEHMVFKGTPNHPDIPTELTKHGARPNGTTSYDRTNYFETFNATDENLDWALDLEADRMINSYISKKDLESEFSVVRNEFEKGENSVTRVLMQNVINAAYLWHNYGQSTIGNRSDIERVPIENLQAFYKKYYRPDNAVLMVTGKFETNKTLKRIVKKFAGIKNPKKPLIDNPTIEPPQDGEKRVNLNRVGGLQIASVLYHTPAGSHEDYAAITLLNKILTDQPSGRLYNALIDKNKASSMWSSIPFTKEPSYLYINVNVPSNKSLTDAEYSLLNTLDKIKETPITQKELDRAKAIWLKEYDQVFRNSSFLGTFMSEFIAAGDWRLAFIQKDRITQMTPEKVNAAAQRYLIKTNRTIGNFTPSKKPTRVSIQHTKGLKELAAAYKGKKGLDEGEVFDVSYKNIQNRLHSGKLQKTPIEYSFIKKNNRGKTITLSFSIKNGNVNDFMNKGSIARYTANMLNKGTKTHTRQDIKDILNITKSSIHITGANGQINANINTTEKHLFEVLELMSDMLKNPSFETSELEKLKTQELASIDQNKTEPQFLARKELKLLNNKFKKGHPLHTAPIEEDIANIKAITIKDIQKYYNDFYGISDHATLVAIGNINEQKLKDYFQTTFAHFKTDKPYKELLNNFEINTPTNKKIKTPDKKNAVSIGIMSFEANQMSNDFAALEIASSIFGGGFLNSRIANRLRQKDGISYGAGGHISVNSNPKNKNSFILVYAIYAPENELKIQIGFKEEIERFIKNGITEKELEVAINSWTQSKSVSRSKDNELSFLIKNNLYFNRDMMFHKNIESKIINLTTKDVNQVIKKHFKPFEKWTVVNAGDFSNKNSNK